MAQDVFIPDPQSPVTFREAPFYNNVYYPVDPGHGGHLIPYSEQIFLPPWEDPRYRYPYPYPYPYYVVEHKYPRGAVQCTVTLYAPQLCCDVCEERVVEAFEGFPYVRKVAADQWEKKVVVTGEDLRPEQVLRHLQRVPHMDRSVFWRDR